MKTTELCKHSKKSWIRDWSNIALIVGVLSLLYLVYTSIEKEVNINQQLNAPTVIYIGDKMVLDKNIKRDTINISIKKLKTDTVIVVNDSLIKDTVIHEVDK